MAKYSAEGLEELVDKEVTVVLRDGKGIAWSMDGKLSMYKGCFEIDNGSGFVQFRRSNVVVWYTDMYPGTELEDQTFIIIKVGGQE